MSEKQIERTIRAWKDPEFRKTLSDVADHPSGSIEANQFSTLGSEDNVNPMTTPVSPAPSVIIRVSLKVCPTFKIKCKV
ncbi:hypothetical protein AU387_19740 [Bacillus halotolerans]|uniref:mersacidin/lichenicidin family type 2 lantibiotic n=1 Tax=Bacillus halotolerans TaxID=260554 RepID=UPI000750B505|nr:mersacidin/lichenicidin family type 2 lantibiotic [Bacillus halotolerans]KUP28913.1 hypothetical protein AU387_19740 [Bacillus halotolerans]